MPETFKEGDRVFWRNTKKKAEYKFIRKWIKENGDSFIIDRVYSRLGMRDLLYIKKRGVQLGHFDSYWLTKSRKNKFLQ